MTNKLVACFLLAVLLGCSKEPARTASDTAKPVEAGVRTPLIVPSEVTVVETAEAKDQSEIRDRVKELFAAKNYAELEKLAAQYRSSKESYPDGHSKLREVYAGIGIPD